MKTIKAKKTKLKSSKEKIKNNKKTIGTLKSIKTTDDDDLLSLLNEADKITLNDLDFDTILNEESKILCNINKIVSKEDKIKGKFDTKNKDNNPLCNIINSNNDSKFKNMLSKYKKNLLSESKKSLKKSSPKKTFKSINLIKHKPTSIKYNLNKSRSKKSRSKKSRTKKSRTKKSRTKKSRTKKSSHKKPRTKKSSYKKSINKKNNKKICQINKLAIKNKNIYKYNNRRKYDVTITNPQIYIKNNSKNNKLKNKK
jgi:hypothetical protein